MGQSSLYRPTTYPTHIPSPLPNTAFLGHLTGVIGYVHRNVVWKSDVAMCLSNRDLAVGPLSSSRCQPHPSKPTASETLARITYVLIHIHIQSYRQFCWSRVCARPEACGDLLDIWYYAEQEEKKTKQADMPKYRSSSNCWAYQKTFFQLFQARTATVT